MRTLIMVTINGDMFLFDNNLNEQESAALQKLADSALFQQSPDFKDTTNIQSQFINIVKQDLGIFLQPL